MRTQGGAEGRIHSGRHVCPIQAPPCTVLLGGGTFGVPATQSREGLLTRALGRETPVELDLLQVEKVH
jgi:hypothetical protein